MVKDKQFFSSDMQKMLLRLVLGVIFIIGGYKIAFPADAQALAISYTNPEKGWIAPYFAEWIPVNLGIDVATFLYYQGLLEMLLGVLLIIGLFTSISAILAGLMYWLFTVANPIVGGVRLSRDLALMGFCFALAYYGQGKWSLDNKWSILYREGKPEIVSLLIRYSLGFTLIISSIFSNGVMSNSLNTTLPVWLVFILGLLLILNVKVRWIALIIGIWMLYIIGNAFVVKPTLFKAIDGPKREIGFLIGTLILYLIKKGDSYLTFQWIKKYNLR